MTAEFSIMSYLKVRQSVRLMRPSFKRLAALGGHLFYTIGFHSESSFMPVTAVSSDTLQLPSPARRRFAWGVLVYFIAVILWGTLVRATGSGNGCGNHWPLCNGTVMQFSPSVSTVIEFTHRLTTGISGLVVVGLLIWVLKGTVRGHLARAAAWASVVFTVIEGMLGAFLVKLGLTAQSHSPLRPAYLALHLANTLLLLAALTLTAHLLSRNQGYLRGSIHLVSPFGAVAGVFVVMIVGVTGSLAALGDTLFPVSSLGLAFEQDFASTSGWLVRWRWMHPTVAFLASILLLWLLIHAVRRGTHWDNRRLSALVLLLLATVFSLGLLDVVLLAPLWLQVAHLLGADTLWVSLVVLTARLTLQPKEAV